jgi:hypothetical protein
MPETKDSADRGADLHAICNRRVGGGGAARGAERRESLRGDDPMTEARPDSRPETPLRLSKNCSRQYHPLGVQFKVEATPALTHGQAAVWAADFVGSLLDADAHPFG